MPCWFLLKRFFSCNFPNFFPYVVPNSPCQITVLGGQHSTIVHTIMTAIKKRPYSLSAQVDFSHNLCTYTMLIIWVLHCKKGAILSIFCRCYFGRQNEQSKNLLSTNNVRQIQGLQYTSYTVQ